MKHLYQLISYCLLVVVLFWPDGGSCLEMLGVSGPQSVNEGDMVTLTCRYDLGRDAIYSMKWYKDDKEVYRYVPTESPEFKSFEVPGIKVDSEATRPNQLVIKVLGPLASGNYRCEITVETPSFVTLDKGLNLTVIVPPHMAPEITGINGYYEAGDLLEITCTSNDSKPAAKLSWKLNGRPAPEGYLLPPVRNMNDETGLETSSQSLRFTAEIGHFPSGQLRLLCEAEIEDVWKTHVESVAFGGNTRDRSRFELRGKQVYEDSSPSSQYGTTRILMDANTSSQPKHGLIRNGSSQILFSDAIQVMFVLFPLMSLHL